MEATTSQVVRCPGCGHFVCEIEAEHATVRTRCADTQCRTMLSVEIDRDRVVVTRLSKTKTA